MKTLKYLSIFYLILIGAAYAEENEKAKDASDASVKTEFQISDVRGMFPIHNIKEGLDALEILKHINDPNVSSEKASLLINLYESQNTPAVDGMPDIPGPPTPERELQLMALEEMRKIDFVKCRQQIMPVLKNYLEFMNSNGISHSRRRLQLSMAYLIMPNVQDKDVRELAEKYLQAPSVQEWTKGRIATSILEYDVSKISDVNDNDLSRRITLVLGTACLPTIEQSLHSPMRLIRSAEILDKLIANQPRKLYQFIQKKKSQLSESEEYFLSYAILIHTNEKEKTQQMLLDEDMQLLEQAKQWRLKSLEKAGKVTGGDQLVEVAHRKYMDRHGK